MSVVEKNKVDGIGRSDDNTKAILMISDHLDWENEYEHLILLQDKINAYINFIESGQAEKMYQGVNGYIILIYFKYEIIKKCCEFLDVVSKGVKEVGIQIEFKTEGRKSI